MRFLIAAMKESGHRVQRVAKSIYDFEFADGRTQEMTIDRELAKDRPDLELIGLDHPLAHEFLERYKRTPEEYIGVAVQAADLAPGVVSVWFVEVQGKSNERKGHVQPVAIDTGNQRSPILERSIEELYSHPQASSGQSTEARIAILKKHLEPMLSRDLRQRGIIPDGVSYSSELIGWVEVTGG